MWNGMIEIGLGERNKQIDDWLNRRTRKEEASKMILRLVKKLLPLKWIHLNVVIINVCMYLYHIYI